MENKVVCVTGASGYIASWLVKLLLQRGYTVKATVRSLSDPNKVVHLKALEGAEERLHLFEANLTDEGSFDSIVDGCEGVFHTASPVFFQATDPQKELIDPAVKGTLGVLNSCKKMSSIKRVVLLSSMASVIYRKNSPRSAEIIDETWFSDPTHCEEQKQWYPLSKTLAEKAAWEFAEENGIDLITLHPGIVIGPLLQPTLNFSSKIIVDFIQEGKEMLPGGVCIFVDVRDVCEAHILAFENPLANGRYCLVGNVSSSSQVMEILKGIFPSLNVPPIVTDNNNNKSYPSYEVSNEKAKSLGVKFTPLEDSLKDIVESLKEKNFIKF